MVRYGLRLKCMKKEVIYTMPYETEKDIKEARELRQDLYEKFNSVQVCPNGLYEVRIICEDEINEK
jgi:hypothetical protein